MRLLELFSGTGSIGVAFEKRGFEVTSVDIDPKAKATFTCDILDFDYRQFAPGTFDVIFLSHGNEFRGRPLLEFFQMHSVSFP